MQPIRVSNLENSMHYLGEISLKPGSHWRHNDIMTYRHKHNDIKKDRSFPYVVMFLCSAVHSGT